MKRKDFTKARATNAQQAQGGLDAGHGLAQLDRGSPFLTLAEGAAYCRFDTCVTPTAAFRKWLHRQAVPIVRRGRMLLVERRVLDLVLKGV
jgi:hypothetical protein